MKKMEPELTVDDKDKLKRLGDVVPVVKHALTYIENLEKQIRSYERWAEGVSQALNSGDGAYRP